MLGTRKAAEWAVRPADSVGSVQETSRHASQSSAMFCYCAPCSSCSTGLELSHLLFKHSSVNKMLVGAGKQPMLLLEICWQLKLRVHRERCAHLQLHRIWAGLSMCCKKVLRHFQNHLAGWLQSKACTTAAGTLHTLRALQHTARLTTATLGTLTSMPARAIRSCLS